MLPHDVAQRSLERAGELRSRADHRVELVVGVVDDAAGMERDVALGRERGRRLAGAPAEHDGLGQRVPAEPVGAVQSGGALARRVQADHVGGVGLGLDHDAAHRVVRGRRDLHRLARDVEHLVLDELAVHAGQLRQDERPCRRG